MTQDLHEIRQPPSAEGLNRLCERLLPGGRVGRVRRPRGGVASAMHAVDLISPDGERLELMVRRYGASRLRSDPKIASWEWQLLRLLHRSAPVPEPLLVDEDGELFGVPSIVMRRVPGRPILNAKNQDAWVRQLAEALVAVHSAPLTDAELAFLPAQRVGIDRLLTDESSVSDDLGRVRSILRVGAGQIERQDPGLVHGDYWAGNVLWRRARVVAVIDWEQPTYGDQSEDVGYCRADLSLIQGIEAADRFLSQYQLALGRGVPNLWFWDLLGVARALPEQALWLPGYLDLGRGDLSVPVLDLRLRAFMADAIARSPRR